MDLGFFSDTVLTLIGGVPLTLKLASIAMTAGSLMALLLALMRLSGTRALEAPAKAYVFVIRGTPLLIQLFLIYYGLGQFRPTLQDWGLWPVFREPYWCAIIALALNTAAYTSEIIRGGLQSVPHGQVEAARSCGMSGLLLYRRIVLPIAVRQALPAYGSEIILILKATSLASIITMMEVTGLAAKLISETYRTTEVFVIAGLIYLSLNFVITRAVMGIEWWLSPHLRNPVSPRPRAEAARP